VPSRLGNAQIDPVAKTRDPEQTDPGSDLLPTATFADVPRADILCVPGGFGTVAAMEDTEMLDWVRNTRQRCEVGDEHMHRITCSRRSGPVPRLQGSLPEDEERWRAYGQVGGQAVFMVAPTYRNNNGQVKIRIISARMTRRVAGIKRA
jgi:hypothetical protein